MHLLRCLKNFFFNLLSAFGIETRLLLNGENDNFLFEVTRIDINEPLLNYYFMRQ